MANDVRSSVGESGGKRVVMECHEGGSNKDYAIWVEAKGDGFIVPFLYGAIGGTKQSGCKTPAPVSLAEAEKVMAKIVKEKKAKGYVEGGDVAAYSQVAGKVDSGVRPMLLTPADEEDDLERFTRDIAWAAQEKVNGLRLLVRVKDGKVTAINKKGLERSIPLVVSDALEDAGSCLIDGELVGEVYHAFDLLEWGGGDRRSYEMVVRHRQLYQQLASAPGDVIRVVPLAREPETKRGLVENLRRARKEGVVFKHVAAIYEPGRRENLADALAVKVKFIKELSAVVKTWNGAKASVELAVFDGDREVSIGSCTVPAKYASQVRPGVVVNVRYLYATAGNKLHQPRLDPTDAGIVVREDVEPKECRFSQLVYEGKGEEANGDTATA